MFTLDELEAAAQTVYAAMPPTPQYAWPLICEEAGCEVWLKHENHTPMGAFKVRGGFVYLKHFVERAPKSQGLISATRGNHGQSLPYAARRYGVPVKIYVPKGNSAEKNASMRALGAELVEYGDDFDEARMRCEAVAEEEGLELVPAFHPDLVRGVASYARELFSTVGDLDAVYVPIGMGSGVCGMIRTRDLLGLTTEIIGVVSREAPAMALSVEAGHVVQTNSAHTFADGLAVRVPNEDALAVIAAGAARIVQVSDDEVAESMRTIFRATHNVAEGAGAAAFAAVLQEREANKGRKVAAILSGGNVDARVFAQVLEGVTPSP